MIRLKYSLTLYHIWYVLAVLCLTAAGFCVWFWEWGWVMGWLVGALALSAHARLEKLDGHEHRSGVEVP